MVILMYLNYSLYRLLLQATSDKKPGLNNHWLFGTGQVLSPDAVYNTATSPDKVIHKCQTVYLHNLLKPSNRTCNLRSSDHDQLVVPRASSKMSERVFSVAAPQL